MPINLSGRSFLKLLDYTPTEIRYLLDLSREFKTLKRTGVAHAHLQGKQIVLLFAKTSTRTRCAFEVAGADLGMAVTYLEPGSSQMDKKESTADTARVLGRFYDGIEYRGFDQAVVEELADKAGVPVWNGLTDQFHPTQMLADLMTVEEKFHRLEGLRLVFLGDARNNVARSLMVACAKMGMHFVACAPAQLFPDAELVSTCQQLAQETGGSVTLETDVSRAVQGAHVLYTDVWVSMGEPAEIWAERIALLKPYQVRTELFELADPQAIFLHCLPAFHDRKTEIGSKIYDQFGLESMEVTDEVFESIRSHVFDQAENRMHTIKAVMYATLR